MTDSPSVGENDRRFLSELDARLETAALPVLQHLQCRLGCTECCIGPFDITALDAWRLRRGLAELRRRLPEEAAAAVARARSQWLSMQATFPGDSARGWLADDEDARLRFFTAHADEPCPLLHPTSGACLLYAHRPVSCRTFGLPLRTGGELLQPCHLNFRGAPAGEVRAAARDPDPADAEGHLLARLAEESGERGDTLVVWVLATVQP